MRQGEAYQKEQSAICNEDDVGELVRVTRIKCTVHLGPVPKFNQLICGP